MERGRGLGCVAESERGSAEEEEGKIGTNRGSRSCNGVMEPGVEVRVKEGDINAGMSCEPEVESGVGGSRGDWGFHVHHAMRIRISDVAFVENRSLRGQDNSTLDLEFSQPLG